MKKAARSSGVALPILFALAILQSCGGGDSDQGYYYPAEEPYQPPPVLAWIEIDTPTEGQSYTKLPITVSGRAGMKDGSTPDSGAIRIQFDYSSTVHDLEGTITCDPTCIVNWETTLTSSNSTANREGGRTMRVWFEDAWDGVKVAYTASRYKVSGKVTYSGSASSNDKIRLWLDDKIEASVDINGAYQFEVKEGSYVLAPRLGPIKDGCMTFHLQSEIYSSMAQM